MRKQNQMFFIVSLQVGRGIERHWRERAYYFFLFRRAAPSYYIKRTLNRCRADYAYTQIFLNRFWGLQIGTKCHPSFLMDG